MSAEQHLVREAALELEGLAPAGPGQNRPPRVLAGTLCASALNLPHLSPIILCYAANMFHAAFFRMCLRSYRSCFTVLVITFKEKHKFEAVFLYFNEK